MVAVRRRDGGRFDASPTKVAAINGFYDFRADLRSSLSRPGCGSRRDGNDRIVVTRAGVLCVSMTWTDQPHLPWLRFPVRW